MLKRGLANELKANSISNTVIPDERQIIGGRFLTPYGSQAFPSRQLTVLTTFLSYQNLTLCQVLLGKSNWLCYRTTNGCVLTYTTIP
jgi:hypothetical protein